MIHQERHHQAVSWTDTLWKSPAHSVCCSWRTIFSPAMLFASTTWKAVTMLSSQTSGVFSFKEESMLYLRAVGDSGKMWIIRYFLLYTAFTSIEILCWHNILLTINDRKQIIFKKLLSFYLFCGVHSCARHSHEVSKQPRGLGSILLPYGCWGSDKRSGWAGGTLMCHLTGWGSLYEIKGWFAPVVFVFFSCCRLITSGVHRGRHVSFCSPFPELPWTGSLPCIFLGLPSLEGFWLWSLYKVRRSGFV